MLIYKQIGDNRFSLTPMKCGTELVFSPHEVGKILSYKNLSRWVVASKTYQEGVHYLHLGKEDRVEYKKLFKLSAHGSSQIVLTLEGMKRLATSSTNKLAYQLIDVILRNEVVIYKTPEEMFNGEMKFTGLSPYCCQLRAARMVKEEFGIDYSHMVTEKEELYLFPSHMGYILGLKGSSWVVGKQINQSFERLGYQKNNLDYWIPTKEAIQTGLCYLDPRYTCLFGPRYKWSRDLLDTVDEEIRLWGVKR